MGTNFYWKIPYQVPQEIKLPSGKTIRWTISEYETHIGKRSAAGSYCWDCNITLCKLGVEGVHSSKSEWFETCPRCGKSKDEPWNNGAAGLELGFAKPRTNRPQGVKTASSFNWAEHPTVVRLACSEHLDEELIEDEYNRSYTGHAFLEMLEMNCPIEYMDMIGQEFS